MWMWLPLVVGRTRSSNSASNRHSSCRPCDFGVSWQKMLQICNWCKESVEKTSQEELWMSHPFNNHARRLLFLFVAGAGYGLDHTRVIDILKTIRSAKGFAVAVVMKPFSFEGQRRLDEVKDLVGKLKEYIDLFVGKQHVIYFVRIFMVVFLWLTKEYPFRQPNIPHKPYNRLVCKFHILATLFFSIYLVKHWSWQKIFEDIRFPIFLKSCLDTILRCCFGWYLIIFPSAPQIMIALTFIIECENPCQLETPSKSILWLFEAVFLLN